MESTHAFCAKEGLAQSYGLSDIIATYTKRPYRTFQEVEEAKREPSPGIAVIPIALTLGRVVVQEPLFQRLEFLESPAPPGNEFALTDPNVERPEDRSKRCE